MDRFEAEKYLINMGLTIPEAAEVVALNLGTGRTVTDVTQMLEDALREVAGRK